MKSVKSVNQWQSVIQTNYKIVQAHGGEIKIESKMGEASSFTIILPVQEI